MDLEDYPGDARVLYYLGVDHASILNILRQGAKGAILEATAQPSSSSSFVSASPHLTTTVPSWRQQLRSSSSSSSSSLSLSSERWQQYESHWREAVRHLRRRNWGNDGSDDADTNDSDYADAIAAADAAHSELAWGAAMWLGRVLSGDLRPRARDALLDDEALRALDRCIALDGERVECRLQKVRLLLAATGASTASLGRDEDDDEFGSRGAKRKRAKQ